MPPYHYLDHDADLGIAVDADDLEAIWDLSARALIGVMTDADLVEQKTALTLELDAPDLVAAWVESLAEVLYRFEVEGLLLVAVDRLEITLQEDGVRVRFRAHGERYDPERHPAGTGVKAVTHHRATLAEGRDGTWTGRVLLDL